MTTKTDELKPCPFCGGPGERQSGGEGAIRRYGCGCAKWKCVGHASALFHKNQQDAVDEWNTRAALQSQPMPPEINRDLLGGIVDQVFGGAIEDTTVIEDIYRVIACEFALRSQGPSDPTLPHEQALAELVDKIIPGLDTGDLLADAQQASAALQSQDREDAIPANIRLMAERIAADNFEHCTADPIFIVQRKRLITGIVPDYTESIGWFDEDGNLISGEEAERLEAEYEGTGAEPDGCTRTGYFEEWEHFATYVTMEAAQELVEKKGDQYRVYVDSGCRNHEWKALRAFLLSLAPTRRSIEGDVN